MADIVAFSGDVTFQDEDALGVYSNVCKVELSVEELSLHFGQRGNQDPNSARGVVKVILSPQHAKRLTKVLADTIVAYERIFGEIQADAAQRLTAEGRKQLEASLAQKKHTP